MSVEQNNQTDPGAKGEVQASGSKIVAAIHRLFGLHDHPRMTLEEQEAELELERQLVLRGRGHGMGMF